MVIGVTAALVSALCYGIAVVLQAKAARVAPAGPGTGTLFRLVVRAPFIGGLLLDVVGFAAQFTALRSVPVFLVQAAQAGSLAITAAVAGLVLNIRLKGRDGIAVGLVCAGLAALGWTAGPEGQVRTGGTFRLGLVVAVVLLAGAGAIALRMGEPTGSAVTGLVAGLGFGVVALAARALPDLSPARVVTDPAAYALAVGGVVAFLYYARALQRGSVTAVTAAIVAGETLLPAVIGIVVLGDHTRPGTVPFAVAGFAATLAGAAALARFGELPHEEADGDVSRRRAAGPGPGRTRG